MDGKITPNELHRTLAWPAHARCVCGSARVVIQAKTFYPLEEFNKINPELVGTILMTERAATLSQLFVEFTSGVHVRISTTYACEQHKRDLEIAAAKGPSWALVEFDRGVGEDKPIIAPNTDIILV